MKKLLALITIIMLVFAVAACTGDTEDDNNKDSDGKSSENATELTDQVKGKMYNALRIAELKVNEVFTKEVAADETTPVLNAAFADETAVVEFLANYYSEDIAKEIYSYYVTNEKTEEDQTIVKADPYFTNSILDTSKDDVTIEGDADKATVKAPDNTYTVELQDGDYIITEIQE